MNILVVNLITRLKHAYAAACKALGLANKLKRNDLKGAILSRLNSLRSELKKYGKYSFITNIRYTGILA